MKNNTEERFEELLKEFNNRMERSEIKYKDAIELMAYAENLYLRYKEIRKSRDKWKKKYQDLKK